MMDLAPELLADGFRLKGGTLRHEGVCTLPSVCVPEGVVCIGSGCFAGSAALVRAELPRSLRELGVSAFADCPALQSVTLRGGVARLRKCCFSGCVSLTEFDIPGSVAGIGEWAFRGCRNLRRVRIPAGVTDICAEVFLDCPALTIEAEAGSFAAAYAEKFGIRLRTI